MENLTVTREEAELLKQYGYEEDTFFFYAQRLGIGSWHLCMWVEGEDSTNALYSVEARKVFSQYEFDLDNALPAPTLEEIPLPACTIQRRAKDLNESRNSIEFTGDWFINDRVFFVDDKVNNHFPTELKARAMAFILWEKHKRELEKTLQNE